jgi:hypothetical protein
VAVSYRVPPGLLRAIEAERMAQREKWHRDHEWGFGDCSSSAVAEPVKAAVLAEECGEVSRAVLDRDDEGLRRELIQVAAVAIAWLEGFTWLS